MRAVPAQLLVGDNAHGALQASRMARLFGTVRRMHPDLRGTEFADVLLSHVIGQGRRCLAFAARRLGRDLVLKLYYPQAAVRHAYRCNSSIARYEYERNVAFHGVPALAPFIAVPVGFVSSSPMECFLQERVFGEPLIPYLRNASVTCRNDVFAQLRALIECSHEAGLFDLDLHPSNIMVKRGQDGTARPVLFDFNKVPYHVRPPNAIFGWLVKLGLIGRCSRDHRQWKRLQRLRPGRSRAPVEAVR